MNDKDKLKMLRQWYSDYKKLQAEEDKWYTILPNFGDCPLSSAMWYTFEHYTHVIEEVLGDTGRHWLCWWLWEADDDKIAEISGKKKKIKTLQDLLWIYSEDFR